MYIGTPDEFVQALYAVGREFRIGGETTPTSLGLHKSSSASGFRSTSEDESDTSPGRGFTCCLLYTRASNLFI